MQTHNGLNQNARGTAIACKRNMACDVQMRSKKEAEEMSLSTLAAFTNQCDDVFELAAAAALPLNIIST